MVDCLKDDPQLLQLSQFAMSIFRFIILVEVFVDHRPSKIFVCFFLKNLNIIL